jgi:hypothetical protein
MLRDDVFNILLDRANNTNMNLQFHPNSEEKNPRIKNALTESFVNLLKTLSADDDEPFDHLNHWANRPNNRLQKLETNLFDQIWGQKRIKRNAVNYTDSKEIAIIPSINDNEKNKFESDDIDSDDEEYEGISDDEEEAKIRGVPLRVIKQERRENKERVRAQLKIGAAALIGRHLYNRYRRRENNAPDGDNGDGDDNDDDNDDDDGDGDDDDNYNYDYNNNNDDDDDGDDNNDNAVAIKAEDIGQKQISDDYEEEISVKGIQTEEEELLDRETQTEREELLDRETQTELQVKDQSSQAGQSRVLTQQNYEAFTKKNKKPKLGEQDYGIFSQEGRGQQIEGHVQTEQPQIGISIPQNAFSRKGREPRELTQEKYVAFTKKNKKPKLKEQNYGIFNRGGRGQQIEGDVQTEQPQISISTPQNAFSRKGREPRVHGIQATNTFKKLREPRVHEIGNNDIFRQDGREPRLRETQNTNTFEQLREPRVRNIKNNSTFKQKGRGTRVHEIHENDNIIKQERKLQTDAGVSPDSRIVGRSKGGIYIIANKSGNIYQSVPKRKEKNLSEAHKGVIMKNLLKISRVLEKNFNNIAINGYLDALDEFSSAYYEPATPEAIAEHEKTIQDVAGFTESQYPSNLSESQEEQGPPNSPESQQEERDLPNSPELGQERRVSFDLLSPANSGNYTMNSIYDLPEQLEDTGVGENPGPDPEPLPEPSGFGSLLPFIAGGVTTLGLGRLTGAGGFNSDL